MAPTDAFQLYSSVRCDASLRGAAANLAFAHAGWNYAHSSPFYMLDFHRDRLLRAATFWGWEAAVAAVAGESGIRRLEGLLHAHTGALQGPDTGPKRCRIVLDKDGQLSCGLSEATEAQLVSLFPPQLPAPGFMTTAGEGAGATEEDDVPSLLLELRSAQGRTPYDVTLDVENTASSAHTHYKTTRRQMYDAARQRAGITGPELKEVLLVNQSNGMVMDGSVSTVYFWRNSRWVTPPVPPKFAAESGSGGLDGTSRRWALERYALAFCLPPRRIYRVDPGHVADSDSSRKLAVQEEVRADSLQDGEECWLSNGVRGFLFGRIRLQ